MKREKHACVGEANYTFFYCFLVACLMNETLNGVHKCLSIVHVVVLLLNIDPVPRLRTIIFLAYVE